MPITNARLPGKAGRWEMAIATPKHHTELLNALNETLDTLIADGTVAQLWQKWIPGQPFPLDRP